ncbi:MAG: anti-sigma factor family protein [Gemmatimonadales bacterium]
MNCGEFEVQLGPYLDDELSESAARTLEEHRRGCRDCTQAHERQLAVRAAMKEHLSFREPPDILRASIRRAIRATTAPVSGKPTSGRRWSSATVRRGVATAAGLALVAAVTWQVAVRHAGANRLAGDVLASHVRSLMGNHLTDIATSDQHTVKPWFDGKLDYSPPVPDFAGRGYPLIGGRLDYVGGRPVAALVYGRRQHMINVFVWPVERARADGSSASTRQGYHMLHWSTPEYSYWVVSDLGVTELTEFSRLLQRADATR